MVYMSFQLTKALINNHKIQTKLCTSWVPIFQWHCLLSYRLQMGPMLAPWTLLSSRDAHPIRRFIIRSRKISRFVFRIVRSFRNLTGTLGSNAAEAPVQFQSDTNILTSDLARFYDLTIRRLIGYWNGARALLSCSLEAHTQVWGQISCPIGMTTGGHSRVDYPDTLPFS